MLSQSVKLIAKTIRNLPTFVSTKVQDLQARNRTRNCTYNLALNGIYLDEDCDYTFFNLKGEKMQVNMDGEWSGYSNHPIRSAVAKTAPLPEGCFCVEFQWFLGHPFIRVYHNPNPAFPELKG
jgi:hypothetical protein